MSGVGFLQLACHVAHGMAPEEVSRFCGGAEARGAASSDYRTDGYAVVFQTVMGSARRSLAGCLELLHLSNTAERCGLPHCATVGADAGPMSESRRGTSSNATPSTEPVRASTLTVVLASAAWSRSRASGATEASYWPGRSPDA